jgi:DNA-binding LytR/AlgR family response regulator
VHRSCIVNLDQVVSIEPHDERRLTVVLRGGKRAIASRSGSLRLKSLAR